MEMCLLDVIKDFVATAPADRIDKLHQDRHKVTEGCYLLYALACRKVGKLTYVYPDDFEGGDDVPVQILRDFDRRSGFIEIKLFETTGGFAPITPQSKVLSTEPTVPFAMIKGPDYRETQPFDYVFLAQSPAYTPVSADPLIDVISEYITLYV